MPAFNISSRALGLLLEKLSKGELEATFRIYVDKGITNFIETAALSKRKIGSELIYSTGDTAVLRVNLNAASISGIVDKVTKIDFIDYKNDVRITLIDTGDHNASAAGISLINRLEASFGVRYEDGKLIYGPDVVPKVLSRLFGVVFSLNESFILVTKIGSYGGSYHTHHVVDRDYSLVAQNNVAKLYKETTSSLILQWDMDKDRLYDSRKDEERQIIEIIGQTHEGVPSFVYNNKTGEITVNNAKLIDRLSK